MFDVKVLLVTLVVSLSALVPLSAHSVAGQPTLIVRDGARSPDAVILDLRRDAVDPELKTIEPAEPKTTVSLGASIDALVGLLMTGVTAFVSFLAWLKKRTFNAEMDERHKAAIHDAARNGVLWAVAKLREKYGDALEVDVKSTLLATVGQYLVDTVPDALKWFKFDMSDRKEYEDIVTANAAKLGIDLATGKAVGTAFAP